MSRRTLQVLLYLLGGIFLLLSGVTVLMIFNAFNPLTLAFITSFTIENKLREPIYISPMGISEGSRQRRLLPQYWWPLPAIPAFQWGNFQIDSGKTRTFYFDWDDINFSEIYIKTGQWQKIFIVDPEADTKDCCWEPLVKSFIIEDTTPLSNPTREMIEAARRVWPWRLILFTAMGFISPPMVVVVFSKIQANRNCKLRRIE